MEKHMQKKREHTRKWKLALIQVPLYNPLSGFSSIGAVHGASRLRGYKAK